LINKLPKNVDAIIEIANLEDAPGIHKALKENLVEIHDFDKITKKQLKELEENGFLRKEVDLSYYEDLIKDPLTDIYVAKVNNGAIIGFASLHKKKYNVYNIRSVLDNIYADDDKTRELLIGKEKEFVYLDQISVIPEYKRKGVGSSLIKKALSDLELPVVAFVVEEPLKNKASMYWHEQNGFELAAKSDGEYKGQLFKFFIYVNWN
jgi:ribosomal protein S18 acetylase RimI-like enzyme